MGCGASKNNAGAEPGSAKPANPPVEPAEKVRPCYEGQKLSLLTHAEAEKLGLDDELLTSLNHSRPQGESQWVVVPSALIIRLQFGYNDQLMTVLSRRDMLHHGGTVGLLVILDIVTGILMDAVMVSFPTSTCDNDRLLKYATFEGKDIYHSVDLDGLVKHALKGEDKHDSKDVDAFFKTGMPEVIDHCDLEATRKSIALGLKAFDANLHAHDAPPVKYRGMLVSVASHKGQPHIHGSHLVVCDGNSGRVLHTEALTQEGAVGHDRRGQVPAQAVPSVQEQTADDGGTLTHLPITKTAAHIGAVSNGTLINVPHHAVANSLGYIDAGPFGSIRLPFGLPHKPPPFYTPPPSKWPPRPTSTRNPAPARHFHPSSTGRGDGRGGGGMHPPGSGGTGTTHPRPDPPPPHGPGGGGHHPPGGTHGPDPRDPPPPHGPGTGGTGGGHHPPGGNPHGPDPHDPPGPGSGGNPPSTPPGGNPHGPDPHDPPGPGTGGGSGGHHPPPGGGGSGHHHPPVHHPDAPDLPPATLPTTENVVSGQVVAWTMPSVAPASGTHQGKIGHQSIYVEDKMAQDFEHGLLNTTIELYVKPKQSTQTITVQQRRALSNYNVERAKLVMTIDPHANTVSGHLESNALVNLSLHPDAASIALGSFSFTNVFPSSVTTAVLEEDQWAHIALVFGPSATHATQQSATLYVDGNLHAHAATVTGVDRGHLDAKLQPKSTHPWVYDVGLQGTTDMTADLGHATMLDELRVWSSARSAMEINQTISSRVLQEVDNLAIHLMGFQPLTSLTESGGVANYAVDPEITSCHAHGNGSWFRHVQDINTYAMHGHDKPPKLINSTPDLLMDHTVVCLRDADTLLYMNAKSSGALELGQPGFNGFRPLFQYVDAVGGLFEMEILNMRDVGEGVDIRLRSVLDKGPKGDDRPYLALDTHGNVTWLAANQLGTTRWHLHGTHLEFHQTSAETGGLYLGVVGGVIKGTTTAAEKLAVFVDQVNQEYVKWDHIVTTTPEGGSPTPHHLSVTPMLSYQCSKDAHYPESHDHEVANLEDSYMAMFKVKLDALGTAAIRDAFPEALRMSKIKFGIRSADTTHHALIINGVSHASIPTKNDVWLPVNDEDGALHISYTRKSDMADACDVPEFNVTILNFVDPVTGDEYPGMVERSVMWPVRLRTGLRQNLPTVTGAHMKAMVPDSTPAASKLTDAQYQILAQHISKTVTHLLPGVGRFVSPGLSASAPGHLTSDGKKSSTPSHDRHFHTMGWFSDGWHGLVHGVKSGYHSVVRVVNTVKDEFNRVRRGVEVFVEGIGSKLIQSAEDMGDMIGGIYDSIKAKASDAWNSFCDWVAQQLGFTDLKLCANSLKSFMEIMIPNAVTGTGAVVTDINNSVVKPFFSTIETKIDHFIRDNNLSAAAADLDAEDGSDHNTVFNGLLKAGSKVAGTLGSILAGPQHFATWLLNWIQRKVFDVLGGTGVTSALTSALHTAFDNDEVKAAFTASSSGGLGATWSALETRFKALLLGDMKHKAAAMLELLKMLVSGLETAATHMFTGLALLADVMKPILTQFLNQTIGWAALTSLLHKITGETWSFSISSILSWMFSLITVPAFKLAKVWTKAKPVFTKQLSAHPYFDATHLPNFAQAMPKAPKASGSGGDRNFHTENVFQNAFKALLCPDSANIYGFYLALYRFFFSTFRGLYRTVEVYKEKGIASGNERFTTTFVGLKVLSFMGSAYEMAAVIITGAPGYAGAAQYFVPLWSYYFNFYDIYLRITGEPGFKPPRTSDGDWRLYKKNRECKAEVITGCVSAFLGVHRHLALKGEDEHEEALTKFFNYLCENMGEMSYALPLWMNDNHWNGDPRPSRSTSPLYKTLLYLQGGFSLAAATTAVVALARKDRGGWV